MNKFDANTDYDSIQIDRIFRLFFEGSPEYCYIVSPEGLILNVNPAALKALGYKKSEIVGKPLLTTIYAPGSRGKARRIFDQWRQSGTLRDEELNIVTKSGEERTVLLSAEHIADETGAILYSVSIQRDFTGRKQIEDVLRETNARLNSIFRAAPVGIGLVSDRVLLEANERLCEMTGYSRSEMIGQSARILYQNDEDFNYVGSEKYRQISEHGTGTVETRWKRKDGVVIDVLLSSTPIDTSDLTLGVTFTALDISERIKVETALKENEQKYKNLFRHSNDAIFIHDLKGRIFDANEKTLELLEYSRPEMLSLCITDLHPPEELDASRDAFETITKKGSVKFETRFRKKSGLEFPVEVSSSVFKMGDQNVVQGIVRDLTERNRAEAERLELEQQIQHAQKLESLGILAGGIAHDFNNLLVGVLGNAELATETLSSAAPAREHLLDVQTAAKRAADLCSQLLAYSGKGRFVIQPININELILDMTHLLEISVSKTVTLKYTLANQLSSVEADATQIRQVVLNIVTNASESMGKKNGLVTLSTGEMDCDSYYFKDTLAVENCPEGRYVFLEVSDNGCGMEPETIAKIFDPFYSTKFTGRGLGLAAVQGIIHGHRGLIKVYSEPGSGTTFKILFPASEQPAVALIDDPGVEEDFTGSGRVLIVDDERSVLDVSRKILERRGFDVKTASDGLEALEIFQQHSDSIDVVILDLTMPKMGGEEALRKLRRIRADVPIILASGYNEQEVTNRFVGKGLAGFIQKPFQTSTLMKILQDVLARRR
jgi:two-component system cell cycle sensor histidine kinase/response regulator CckA